MGNEKYWLVLGLVFGLAACSGEAVIDTTDEASVRGSIATELDDGPRLDLSAAPKVGEYETLHKVSVAGQLVTFLGYEVEQDRPAILVQGYSPTFERSVLDQMLDQHGLLTSLEVFLALAGEEATPHPFLLASHEQQARDSMRANLDVQHVDFHPAVVEKVGASSCDSFIFDDSFLQNSDPTLFGGEWGYFLPVISKGPYTTTARRDICSTSSTCALTFKRNTQTIGVCSDGNHSSQPVTNFGSGWVFGPSEALGAGGVRWIWYYPGGPQIGSVQTTANTTATYYQRANQLQWICTAAVCNFPAQADQRF